MKKTKVLVVTGFEPAYPDSVDKVGALSIKLHDMLCSTVGLEFHIKNNFKDDAIANFFQL